MPRVKHYAQLILFDTLALICMALAIATGWLPGPGGIPLFILGLSLLAINHTWAKRYIDLLRRYADKVSDLIFIPRLRVAFDVLAAVLCASGILLITLQTKIWILSLGIVSICFGLLCLFGNRNRWARLKKSFKKRKHL
jgi:hypothetical protein